MEHDLAGLYLTIHYLGTLSSAQVNSALCTKLREVSVTETLIQECWKCRI
jgi:hypothetical protein